MIIYITHYSSSGLPLFLGTLAVGLGGVVTTVNDQILRAVVELASEVALQDGLGAVGVALLRIQRGTRHVGDHGVAAAEGVLGVAQDVVLGCGLGEPNITTVAAEVAGLQSIGDILLDDDGATGSVDKPRTCGVIQLAHVIGQRENYWRGKHTLLHLADQVLVEQTTSLLVQRAVDGDNITLRQHLLKVLDATAANLLLLLGAQRLVVVVQQLLAVKGLETAQHTLTNAANSDGADNLVLEVELVLGGGGDVPLASLNLLVRGHKVAHQRQDGHDNMLSDGHDVGTGDLGDGDTAVGLIGSVQVDVIGADTGGHGQLQVLGLGKALSSQVTGVEAVGLGMLVGISLV